MQGLRLRVGALCAGETASRRSHRVRVLGRFSEVPFRSGKETERSAG